MADDKGEHGHPPQKLQEAEPGEEAAPPSSPSPSTPAMQQQSNIETEEDEETMLHCVRDTEDAIEEVLVATTERGDEDSLQQQQQDDQAPSDAAEMASKDDGDASIVGRPAPPLLQLLMTVLDDSTGLLSALKINTKREAGPLDLALLCASRRPPWTLFVEKSDISGIDGIAAGPPSIVVAQERALVLRRGPDYSRASQVQLKLPAEEPLFLPGCWVVAFAPSIKKEKGKATDGRVAVAGWSGAIHVFSTTMAVAGAATASSFLSPALTIPALHKDTHQMPPEEEGLVADLSWRGSTDLLILRYSGSFQRLTLRPPANAPETLEVVGQGEGSSGSSSRSSYMMDLKPWHRGGCSAMTYDHSSGRVVVAGGSLRQQPRSSSGSSSSSSVTVWRCAPEGCSPPLIIEHQFSIPVGNPLLLKPTTVRHQQAGFFRRWFGGAGLASALDAKVPVQCPILHLSLSPRGGKLLAALDLEGGLSLFAFRGGGSRSKTSSSCSSDGGAWGPLGSRMTSLPIGDPAARKNFSIAAVAWWSPSALAVLDKKGHAQVFKVAAAAAAEAAAAATTGEQELRFRPLLSTDLPVGRGASLASAGDNCHLLALQCYVGLNGRLRGKLVRVERQSPEEAMLSFGKAGQVIDALEVATQYGLDTDPMFKAVWLREGGGNGVREVQEVLTHVRDTSWVVQQVLDEGGREEGVDCAVLEVECKLALERTESAGEERAKMAGDASLCLLRCKVLELYDRVKTFQVLFQGGTSATAAACKLSAAASASAPAPAVAAAWAAFYRRPLREVAEDVASEGNVRGLLHIIHQHPLTLGPADIADLLRLLPEALPPSSYQQLLPGLMKSGGSGSSNRGASHLQLGGRRPLDWVEEGRLPKEWEDFWTPSTLERWYLTRAEEVERKGGALGGNVIELMNIGLARGCPERGPLSNFRAEVWHLTKLLYAGFLGGGRMEGEAEGGNALTLQAWRALPLRLVMRRVLEQVPLVYMEDPPLLVQTIESYLLPMVRGPLALTRAEQQQQHLGVGGDDVERALAEEVTDLLVAAVLNARRERTARQKEVYADQYVAAHNIIEAWHAAEIRTEIMLRAAIAVARASKPNLPSDRRLFRCDADLFRLVLKVCRAHDTCMEPSGAADLLWSLIECLPVASEEAAPELQSVQIDVDRLEARLTAAQYLSNYSITLPLSIYERFQTEIHSGALLPLEGWQTDFRALAAWESVMPFSLKRGRAAIIDDDSSSSSSKTRLDLQVVARMAKHLAISLQGLDEQQQRQQHQHQQHGTFWAEIALLASAMAGLQLPATAVEAVVLQLVEDWLQEADSGLDAGVGRARTLLAALPFSSSVCEREARWLEGVALASKLAGDRGWGKADLTPVEVREAANGGYGMVVLRAILETRPKLVLTEDGERDLLRLAELLDLEKGTVGVLKGETMRVAVGLGEYEVAAMSLLDVMPVPKLLGAVVGGEGGGGDEGGIDGEEVWELVFSLLISASSGSSKSSNSKKLSVELMNRLLHRALLTAPPHQLPRFVQVATEDLLSTAWSSSSLPLSSSSLHERSLQKLALEDYKRSLQLPGESGKEGEEGREKQRDDALLGLVEEAMGKARERLMLASRTSQKLYKSPSSSPIFGGNAGQAMPASTAARAAQEWLERALVFLLGLGDGRRGVAWAREAVAQAEMKAQEEAAEAGRRAQMEGDTRLAQGGGGGRDGGREGGDEGWIVKQLLAKGYSRNGAVRTARAAGNKSVDAAIQWAIAHSHDLGFDDPLPPSSSSSSSSFTSPSSPLGGLGNAFAFPRPHSPWREEKEDGVGGGREGGRVDGQMLELTKNLAIRYLCLEALVTANAAGAARLYCATAEELLKHTMAMPGPPPLLEEGEGVREESLAILCRREVAAYSQEAGWAGLVTKLQAFVPWKLEKGRLRSDDEYRTSAVLAAAQQDVAGAWNAAMVAAEGWHVDKEEMGLAHVEYWFRGPLKEGWVRFGAAGAMEAIARFESVALGKKANNSSVVTGEPNLPASSSLLGSPGSAGALLIASEARAQKVLPRLAALWEGVDGRALPLLELLGRIMVEVAAMAEEGREGGQGGGGGGGGVSKRLKDHAQLLRRLVRVPGLVPLLDYKALTGNTHPFLFPSSQHCETEVETAAIGGGAGGAGAGQVLQTAYHELVRVVRRDNVGALGKLAPRILLPGTAFPLSASTINRAYADALLRGLDPLLAEEENSLPLARATPPERFAHRLFLAEPYLERMTPTDLIGLVEGLCVPRRQKGEGASAVAAGYGGGVLVAVGPCLPSVVDRLAVVHKAASLLQQGKSSSSSSSAAEAFLHQVTGLLEALMLCGGEKSSDGRALESAWVQGADVTSLLESMLVEGRGGGWVGIEALIASLKTATTTAATTAGSSSLYSCIILPVEGAVGVLVAAVKHLLSAPLPFSKLHLKKLEALLRASVATSNSSSSGDEGVEARWALVLPLLLEFVTKEEEEEGGGSEERGEGVSAPTAAAAQSRRGGVRADVIEMVLGLGRDLGMEGGGEAMLEYHRAAEMMWEGLGRKLSREEASTVEGRVQALLNALEGDKALEKTGAETALALVRMWGGGILAGGGPLGLNIDWSRWVVGEEEEGKGAAATSAPEYDVIYRRLTERALEGRKWNGAASLLLWSPWRYRVRTTGTLNKEEEEEALVAKLDILGAPFGLKLKVMLSSPHASLRAEAVAALPALLGGDGGSGEEGGDGAAGRAVHCTSIVTLPRTFSPPILASDEILLALITAAFFPPPPAQDPLPFLVSPAWRVLADALLLLPSHPKASQPLPLPASVAFVAARLVAGRAYLQAGALLAEDRQLHPALRTVEGVMSVLWTTLFSRTYYYGEQAEDEDEGQQGRRDEKLWLHVRDAAKVVLEADETD
ncbi:deubiquitinating enzyme [Nannochloropsis oceanica]